MNKVLEQAYQRISDLIKEGKIEQAQDLNFKLREIIDGYSGIDS